MPPGIPKAGFRVFTHERWRRVVIVCIVCGGEKHVTNRYRTLVSGRFCSNACSLQFTKQQAALRREARLAAKAERATQKVSALVKVQCQQCGVQVMKWPSQLHKSKRHFCSNRCSYAAHRKGFDIGAWRNKNRHRLRLSAARSRARRREVIRAKETIRRSIRHRATDGRKLVKLIAAAQGYCVYCGRKSDKLEADHVVAVANGGSGKLSNFIPCCHWCNASKGKRSLTAWLFEKHGIAGLGRAIYFMEKRMIHLGLVETTA
jgi:hypothetical protein